MISSAAARACRAASAARGCRRCSAGGEQTSSDPVRRVKAATSGVFCRTASTLHAAGRSPRARCRRASVIDDEAALVGVRQESAADGRTARPPPPARTARSTSARTGRRIIASSVRRIGARRAGRACCVAGSPAGAADAQRASSGISVSASTSEISTAAESVSDSARKNCPTTPDSRPSGANTTTVVSVELTTGAISSAIASATARRRPVLHAAMDVLDDDDRVVDDEADGDREAAHRHEVDRLAEPAHDQRTSSARRAAA